MKQQQPAEVRSPGARGGVKGNGSAAAALVMLFGTTALWVASAHATETPPLADVVVTATRVAVPAFDVAGSINDVPAAALRDDAMGINLADDIGFVPGLLAFDRHNYAQDQQVSIRGIGANSTFGIRGVRIYQDGIPQTGPDGQGQISQFNLDSAQRVEVLEGPFSALYGNAAGGVIQIFTAEGAAPGEIRTKLGYGSFGQLRAGVDAGDAVGPLSYNLDFTHFSWDGYRPHQDARNESFNSKVNYTFSPRSKLTFVANVVSRPGADDPLGLTAAKLAANPDQTAPAALQFDTRKSLEQQEGGLIYDLDLTDHQSLRLMGYYGHRTVLQFLSIPAAAQKAPTSSGGVISLDRGFGGGDARWTWQGPVAGRPLSWVAGASFDTQNELRRGYNNFSGSVLGVEGPLRRDENDIAKDIDQYTQASWAFAPRWSLTAGVRHSEVRFISVDHFISALTGNDSGGITYTATSPAAGLLFAPRPWLHLYASYGKGFQTPLDSELAYQPNGAPGLNFALRPARSNNGEVGAKIVSGHFAANLAAFDTRTDDEIVVATNTGGRSTYQNAGRTRRSGAQASSDYRFAEKWRAQIAYTYVAAIYIDGYRTCVAAPCSAPSLFVSSGNRLPGVPRSNAYARLSWGGELGWNANVSGEYLSAIAANDANTAFASAYAVFNAAGGYGAQSGSTQLSVFVRINNILNRRYAGSVIVDDSNAGYFEPAPGCNVFAGITATFR
ncbi:MAG TPA: TonB-dependent receptor [Steroidobacteraceae bacterium]|nr:TonB-dependent receptor [Steroidobacteraceae bacterium]